MNRLQGLLIALSMLVFSCSEQESERLSSELDSRPLIVGMELTYPPFEMRNAENLPDGISVRLAEDLGTFLDRPVKIVDVAWDGMIPALMTGKIDLIISSMTRTPERERSIDFSDGYVTNGLCLLVARDSTIDSAGDLASPGTTVAVKLATTGDVWAKGHLPDANITTLDSAANCVLEVVQGRADAFIYDQISVYQYWQKNPDTTRPILKPIREETWGIGLRKGEMDLKEQVNAFLAEYRESGGFDRLADRYMKAEKAAFEKLGVPFVFH